MAMKIRISKGYCFIKIKGFKTIFKFKMTRILYLIIKIVLNLLFS
jgi:hypothetical protein